MVETANVGIGSEMVLAVNGIATSETDIEVDDTAQVALQSVNQMHTRLIAAKPLPTASANIVRRPPQASRLLRQLETVIETVTASEMDTLEIVGIVQLLALMIASEENGRKSANGCLDPEQIREEVETNWIMVVPEEAGVREGGGSERVMEKALEVGEREGRVAGREPLR